MKRCLALFLTVLITTTLYSQSISDQDIKKGDILKEGVNFEILRPGSRIRGIDSRFLFSINNKKSKIDVMKGDGITEFV